MSEGQIPTVVEYEALWAIKVSRSVLLAQVAGVVVVRRISFEVGQVFAPGIGALQSQSVRKLLTHGCLQAAVIVDAVEAGALQAARLIAQIGRAESYVLHRIGGDPIDGVA